MSKPTKEEIEQARRDSPSNKAKEDAAYMSSMTKTEPAPKKPEVKKYASGGIVRGMGAAKRGGKFVRSC